MSATASEITADIERQLRGPPSSQSSGTILTEFRVNAQAPQGRWRAVQLSNDWLLAPRNLHGDYSRLHTYSPAMANTTIGDDYVVHVLSQDKGEDPFEIIKEGKVTGAKLTNRLTISTLADGAHVADRVDHLIDLAAEDYPDTDIPSMNSISNLSKFLRVFSRVNAPAVSLLASGSIWLSWQRDATSAGLALFGDGRAAFGLLVTSTRKPMRVDVSGTIDQVMSRMRMEPLAREVLGQ